MQFSIFEAVRILRGESNSFITTADRIYNAEFYISCNVREAPDEMKKIAISLLEDVQGWSEELGISPDRVVWFSNRLNGIL